MTKRLQKRKTKSIRWTTHLHRMSVCLCLLFILSIGAMDAQPPIDGDCTRDLLLFDGVDDYLDINIPLFSYDAGTIEAWVRKDNWQDAVDDALFTNGLGHGESGSFYLSFHPAVGLHFRYGGTVDAGNTAAFLNASTTNTLQPSSWHHVAATWNNIDGTVELNIYMDGVLKKTAFSTAVLVETAPNQFFGIGKGTTDSHFVLQGGSVAEFRVWDYARTGQEIFTNMNTIVTSSSLAYLPMDETNTSGFTPNEAPQGLDAQLQGFDLANAWIEYNPLVIKKGAEAYNNGWSYDFGLIGADAATSPVTFTVENEGKTTLDMSGRTLEITGVDASEFTLDFDGFTGNILEAGAHVSFTIDFDPSAIDTYYAALTLSSNSCDDYTIDLTGQGVASLSYTGGGFTEPDNDGSVAGNITITVTGDTFQDDDDNNQLEIGTQVVLVGIPQGLAPVLFISVDDPSVAYLNLYGSADFHENANDVGDIVFNFDPSAFTNLSSATPSSSGLGIDFNDAPSLQYAINPGEMFEESVLNDGSIEGCVNIILTGDTFQNPGADKLINVTHFSVVGVPSGLTPIMDLISPTLAKLTFIGQADSHTGDDDVPQLIISFTDAAFTTFAAANIANATNAPTVASITFLDYTENYWLGATTESTDWHNPNNWSEGLPTINHKAVVFDQGQNKAIEVVVSEDVTIGMLEVRFTSGPSLVMTISDESTLTTNEVYTAWEIIIESGSALAIKGNYTGVGGGKVTIHRNVVGNLGYSVVGSPIEYFEIDDFGADLVYSYFEGSFNAETEGDLSVDRGTGYFVAYDESDPAITFSGVPNTGDVTVSTGDTEAFLLLSNPYAAAISRSEFLIFNENTMGNDGAIYLWDDGGTNDGAVRGGGYVTANNFGTSGDAGLKTSSAFNGNIGVGQGFFIYSAQTHSSVTFKQNMQVNTAGANSDDAYYRKAIEDKQIVKLVARGEAFSDDLIVGFTSNATEGLDFNMDARKFMNPGASFYSFQADGIKLAIQALPFINEHMAINLGLNLPYDDLITFEVTKLEGFSDNTLIMLHDKETGLMYDLSSEPVVEISSAVSSTDSRFELIFETKAILGINPELSAIQVYADRSELSLFGEYSEPQQVSVFTLDGRRILSEAVDFQNGRASLKHHLPAHQLYLLRVNSAATKFFVNTTK